MQGTAHQRGSAWKLGGVCFSAFPRNALGLKFKPHHVFLMVCNLFFLPLELIKVLTMIIISQRWKWAQWDSTLVTKIVMREDGDIFGCSVTALVCRPHQRLGLSVMLYHCRQLVHSRHWLCCCRLLCCFKIFVIKYGAAVQDNTNPTGCFFF